MAYATFEDLLEQQEHVFRARQAGAWFSPAEVRHEVTSGRWQKAHGRVVVAHNGPLTVGQRRWAVLLAAPRGSALGGLTAAEMGGLRNFSVSDVHVVIPRGNRRPTWEGVAMHYSDHLDVADVHPTLAPRRTRMARSILDAGSAARTDGACRALVLASVQQRLLRPDHLREALTRRGPCARRSLLLETIDDAAGGIASVPEHDFELIRREFRLPQPARQALRRRRDRHYYLDADFHPYLLSVEIHGTQHMEVLTWEADLDRVNDLGNGGRRLLQFTSYSVRHRKRAVGEYVLQALRDAGWPG